MTGYQIAAAAAAVLNSRKAEDIRVLDIGGVSILADYFLIATGNSTTQVRSLSEEVEDRLEQRGVSPRRVEGRQSATWVILDYGDVIVHVFHRDTRQFFNLERLWTDAKPLPLDELLQADAAQAQRPEPKQEPPRAGIPPETPEQPGPRA